MTKLYWIALLCFMAVVVGTGVVFSALGQAPQTPSEWTLGVGFAWLGHLVGWTTRNALTQRIQKAGDR